MKWQDLQPVFHEVNFSKQSEARASKKKEIPNRLNFGGESARANFEIQRIPNRLNFGGESARANFKIQRIQGQTGLIKGRCKIYHMTWPVEKNFLEKICSSRLNYCRKTNSPVATYIKPLRMYLPCIYEQQMFTVRIKVAKDYSKINFGTYERFSMTY